MFQSISSCEPGTFVTSAFIAEYNSTIDVSNNYIVRVDGDIVTKRPVDVLNGQTVSITIKSQPDYSYHDYIPYTINGSHCEFVVATKSQFIVSILSEAYQKRWWNYLPLVPHQVTYSSPANGNRKLELGYNTNDISIDMHAIIDPLTSSIYFYSQAGTLLKNLKMPSVPSQIIKVSNYFIAACEDGLYKITYDQNSTKQISLQNNEASPMTDWIFELPFETDIPLKGSFLSFAAHKLAVTDSHRPHTISYANNRFWVGGYKKIWQLDENLVLLKTFNVVPGLVTGIQSLGSLAVFCTKFGIAYSVNAASGDVFTPLYQTRWIGNPVQFGKYIAIADANNQKVVLFDMSNNFSQTYIRTHDFAPSYLLSEAGKLYITGHDSRSLLAYDGTNISETVFSDRITTISIANNTIMASHYLRKNNTLDHTGHREILPVEIKQIKSSNTFSGFKPVKITMLGEYSFMPEVPAGVTWFIDGQPNKPVTDGCMLSASFHTDANGIKQFPIILGQSVIDLCIVTQISNYTPKNITLRPVLPDNGLAQIDIIAPNDLTPSVASIDYGYILKNFSEYRGFSQINPGDVISICIPSSSPKNSVSVFTLGDTQFCVPVNELYTNIKTQNVYAAATNSIISRDFVVDVAGTYYAAQNTILKINGVSSDTGAIDLNAGDNITISIMSSKRLFDERRTILTGPSNIELTVKTIGRDTINKISLGTLNEPTIRQTYTSQVSTITGLGKTLDPISGVSTDNKAMLITLDSSIKILKNGEDATSVTEVIDGDKIIVSKFIVGLNDPDAIIYQQLYDPLFSEPFYVDVITWNITNQQISGSSFTAQNTYASSEFNYFASGIDTRIIPSWQSKATGVNYSTLQKLQYKFQRSFNTLASRVYSVEFQNSWGSPAFLRYIVDFYSSANLAISPSFASDLTEHLNAYYADRFISNKETAVNCSITSSHPTLQQSVSSLYASLPFKCLHFADMAITQDAFQSVHPTDSTWYSLRLGTEIAHSSQTELLPFQSVIVVETQKQFSVLASIVEHAEYTIADNFEYVLIESADKSAKTFDNSIIGEIGNTAKIADTKLDALPYTDNTVTSYSLLIKADQQLVKLVNSASVFADVPKIMTVRGYEILAPGELIWNAGPVNNYGAYDTPELAAISANYRGHTPFITIQIPGTDKFTYRKLSDISRVCSIGGGNPVGITVSYGLIQGG